MVSRPVFATEFRHAVPMTLTFHGIPNCDTVRRARAALGARGVAYRFHDSRRDGVDMAALKRWAARVGWERLLNRQGTTFRRLPDEVKADLHEPRALALMAAHPAAIRRPVAEDGETLLVGYDADAYAALG